MTEKKYCDCVDYCERSGFHDDIAFWTPYVPYIKTVCKMTENEHFHMMMKPLDEKNNDNE